MLKKFEKFYINSKKKQEKFYFQVKTCPSLRAPQNGNISCKHEDGVEQRMLSDSLIAQPIDTQCEFKCENGYLLRGSKVRNCLPISSWDGLRTTCNCMLKNVLNFMKNVFNIF